MFTKLEHYGVRGIPLNLIKEYQLNRKKFVTIENVICGTLPINSGVPQDSVLRPLLFLTYINDLNNTVKHTGIHHSADDTNVLYSSKFLKDINKKLNHGLKNIAEWLRANKISLNASKSASSIRNNKSTDHLTSD